MSRRLDASVDVDAGRQADTRYTLDDLLTLMAVLRDPQYGCPWDSRQDYASLVPHTLEEAYEVADVIERAAADASVLEELPAELGDLLFQGVFYAQIASEQQRFDFHDVIHVLTEKMLHRHPHVFPDGTLASRREGIATHEVDEGSLNAQWESLKQQETADAPASRTAGDSVLDGVPIGLPALTRAAKLSKKAARSGFDWPDTGDVLDKITEALAALGGKVEDVIRTRIYLIDEADTRGIHIFLTDVKKTVAQDAKRLKETGALGSSGERASLIQAIDSLPPRISAGGLIEFRKELASEVSRMVGTPGLTSNPAIGLGKQLLKSVDQVLDSELGRQDKRLLETYRAANKIWRQGSERFGPELLDRTLKKLAIENGGNPDMIAKALFQPNHGEKIREALRASIPPQFTEDGFIQAVNVTRQQVTPEIWKKVQRSGVEELLMGSLKDGQIMGSKLMNKLVGVGGIRDKGLRLAFGRQGAANIVKFARTVRTLQTKQGDGTGTVLVQLQQGGALMTLGGAATGNSEITEGGVAILLVPALLSRILMHPKAANALIEGMTLRGGSEAHKRALAGRIFAGIVGPELAAAERERAADTLPTVHSFGSGRSPLSPAFTK